MNASTPQGGLGGGTKGFGEFGPWGSLNWPDRGGCRRAKPGRFGSFAFAMKHRHFSWILAGKARKCGRFWVFVCVCVSQTKPGKQSIWRQCPPSARKQSTKRMPNGPVLPMCWGRVVMGEKFFSSAGAGAKCTLPVRVPNPSTVLEEGS